MRYTEWVEGVLRAVLEGADSPYMFGMPQIGTALCLEMGNWGDEEHRPPYRPCSNSAARLLSLVGARGVTPPEPTLMSRSDCR